MQYAVGKIIGMNKIYLAVLLLTAYCLLPTAAISQELNCNIQILAPQLQNPADKKILETLKQSMYEFMNNRKWTNDVFKQEERIECSIVLTISDKKSDVFNGTMQIQVRRPIYKSSYNSLSMNVLDKNISFNYIEYQPLEFSESSFISNLTSLLAYYSYIIIGTDYDSFVMEGGTPYFQKAQNIVSNAQSSPEVGWKSSESNNQNRYWLVENLLNSTFKPLRECMYKYHRLGFDAMAEDVIAPRSVVLQALLPLKKIHESKPTSYNMQLFFLAKADEIVNLFTSAEPSEKTKVIELLNEIDPANTIKYNKINQKGE